MFQILFTLLLIVALALAWLFYDKFTHRGAIPLEKAWRDYTAWLAYAGIAFAGWIVELARYTADLWDPLRAQFGDLLAAPSAAMALQILSAIFLVFKLKGQSPLPRPDFPDFPGDAADDTEAPGA